MILNSNTYVSAKNMQTNLQQKHFLNDYNPGNPRFNDSIIL